MVLEVKQAEQESKGVFFIEQEGQRLALMSYSRAGNDLIIIEHTEVSDALRGTGAGKKLVEAAVEWARAGHKQILPLCPFARATFERNPQWADVLR